MYYVYATIVFVLAGYFLWVAVCFHYVLKQKERMNTLWAQVNQALHTRYALYGDLQSFWLAPETPPTQENTHQLQHVLAEEAATDQSDVEKRSELHWRIEAHAREMLETIHKNPNLAGNATLPAIQQSLKDNAEHLGASIKAFNKSVLVYNTLLKSRMNAIIGKRMGLISAPQFSTH
ncbi:MAG: LemA family protein [Alphaproteobacteria bacterium]|nr:LemA family protein [Alphaproteobacteria bacterium]